MKKIISLFKRNYGGDHQVRDEVVEGAEWVIAGEGHATRKFDGTCCLMLEGFFYKRFELRAGKPRPAGFFAAQEPDAAGNQPGWLPVGWGSEDAWHRDAFARLTGLTYIDAKTSGPLPLRAPSGGEDQGPRFWN